MKCAIDTYYPYTRYAEQNMHLLTGLEKLRGIRDRELAGYLATIWQSIPPAGRRK